VLDRKQDIFFASWGGWVRIACRFTRARTLSLSFIVPQNNFSLVIMTDNNFTEFTCPPIEVPEITIDPLTFRNTNIVKQGAFSRR